MFLKNPTDLDDPEVQRILKDPDHCFLLAVQDGSKYKVKPTTSRNPLCLEELSPGYTIRGELFIEPDVKRLLKAFATLKNKYLLVFKKPAALTPRPGYLIYNITLVIQHIIPLDNEIDIEHLFTS